MSKGIITKVFFRTLLISGVFALVVTLYLFSGSEVVGNTFATNGISLKIDSKATYNGFHVPSATWRLKDLVPGTDKFFNFGDIKPGDQGENTISLHVKDTPAWLCLDFRNLTEDDNGNNEPEFYDDIDGDLGGELADEMEFFGWRDDGDNVFEPHKGETVLFEKGAASDVLDEMTYPIGDSIVGGAIPANKTRYIGVYWCAGSLTVNMANGEFICDGSSVGNQSQTDSLSVDVSFRAQPKDQDPTFSCEEEFNEIEGCSPGYWKQPQHFDEWPAPYATSTLFSSVFENAFPGKTLLQVLSLNGGGLNAVGRQTVAALLNASNPGVDFTFTETEIINMFNSEFPVGDYGELKEILEYQNTVYCPLS